MKKDAFTFIEPGSLVDSELELILIEKTPEVPDKSFLPSYSFEMRLVHKRERMGQLSLRIGNNENITYGGHIGYSVDDPYQGNHYAARSCILVFPLARQHGINPVWITCNPDNMASRRTCEIAGGKLIEIVDIPEDNNQYEKGERQKCRYRFDL